MIHLVFHLSLIHTSWPGGQNCKRAVLRELDCNLFC